jgi:hypothetical protein
LIVLSKLTFTVIRYGGSMRGHYGLPRTTREVRPSVYRGTTQKINRSNVEISIFVIDVT